MLGVATEESCEVPVEGAKRVAFMKSGCSIATRGVALLEPGETRIREGASAGAIGAIYEGTILGMYDRRSIGVTKANLYLVVARWINVEVRIDRRRGERDQAVAEEVV